MQQPSITKKSRKDEEADELSNVPAESISALPGPRSKDSLTLGC